MSKYDENSSLSDLKEENKENRSLCKGTEQPLDRSGSVSSTEDVLPLARDDRVAQKEESPLAMAKEVASGKTKMRLSFRVVCTLFVLALAIIGSLSWGGEQRERYHLVPT